jgi:hypothetical protein
VQGARRRNRLGRIEMYDLMTTVSVLVDDIDPAVTTLCGALGLPRPRPQSFREGPGIRAMFCRVHPKYAVAPTFLELVASGPVGDTAPGAGVFPVAEIAARQGSRVIKWHATEISMPDETLLDLSRHLDRLAVPHGFVPSDRRDRFFLGGDPNVSYDPNADAGLIVEAGRSTHLGLPEDAFSAPADIPQDTEPETMVRIVAREYLVDDLDETLGILERNLRWTPASVHEHDGARRAVMPFLVPRSARLELIQPLGPGRVGDAYEEIGAGAWTIRISVVDVDAKAEDLAARGTPFAIEDGVMRPDRECTLQVPFEFVAAAGP